jgi:hypothetical protein
MTYFVHWRSYTPNRNHLLHRRFHDNHHHHHNPERVDLKQILDYTVPSLPHLHLIGICSHRQLHYFLCPIKIHNNFNLE